MDEPESLPAPKLTLCQRVALLIRWHESCVEHFKASPEKKARHEAFTQTAKDCHARLCKKDKLPPPNVPVIAEVLLLASEIALPEAEARKFFHHFESNGWKIGGKTKIKNWQARLKLWKERWLEDREKRPGGAARTNFEEGF